MKKLRKVLALVLVTIMMLALSVCAYAEGETETGSITIKNAEIGKTYEIYKVFDATYDIVDGVKAVNYTCSNAALLQAMENETDGCPFKKVGTDPNPDGSWTVEHVNISDPAAVAAGRGWLKNHLSLLGNPTASQKCESGNTVVFSGLDLGYYLMQPGTGATASVNNVIPDVEIIDKNPTAPSHPKKVASDHLVAVDDTVTYTVSFDTTNFRTIRTEGDNVGQANQIKDYKIVDTFAGQTFVELKSVTVTWEGGSKTLTKDNDFTMTVSQDTATGSGSATYSIPWVNGEGQSIYHSPAHVDIVYTTKMNGHALDNNKFYENNTANIDYKTSASENYIDLVDNPGDPDPSEKVWTTGVSIKKITNKSGQDADLEGAGFVLFMKDGDNNNLYYKWDTTANKPDWVSDIKDADVKTADNDYLTYEFGGIDEGTYYLEEVVVPHGYDKPDLPFTVVITGTDVTDSTGKVTNVTITGTLNGEPSNPAEGNRYITATIMNTVGVALPTTGGAGTVALIAIGAIGFLGPALILVTKKRMYNEG